MTTFSQQDQDLFKLKGIPVNTIEKQIANFKSGFPFTDLVAPAIPGEGIKVLSEKEIQEMITYYDKKLAGKKVIKFVPASGAASRMFKALFEYLEAAGSSDQEELIENDKGFNSAFNFISSLKKFAFLNDLTKLMEEAGLNPDKEIDSKKYDSIIRKLVDKTGLNYGNLPKGLLKFHHYDDTDRVAFEEHLVEAANYAVSNEGKSYVHFTVSPEHVENFKAKVDEVVDYYKSKFNIDYDISFSIQKPSTDTMAVDLENNPFREEDGSILFRPGGHGALIENLGDLEADIVFIKNIDNVVPDRLKPETTKYKKAIGGLIINLQDKVFKYLHKLDENNTDPGLLGEIENFAKNELMINFPKDYSSNTSEEKKDFLFHNLNKPIRICGMVKNEGEPGGGPFWVKNSKGEVSLQIVESSQIDTDNEGQNELLKSSTHFNPVDLVCAIKDYKGNAFDLHKFIDYQTGFISKKSKSGKDLKAQELPGLWNGAMANWNTIFVEVPIITFNPVKTVNDLLRDQHQPM